MERHFEHIVVLMLENRSFDHLFGFLNHTKKFNGLTGQEYNPKTKTDPTKIFVNKSDKPYIDPDPPHSHAEIMQQVDLGIGGKNDGFVHVFLEKQKVKGGTSRPEEIMSVIDPSTPKKCGFIMAELAKRFVLCDNYFSSVPGETWPNRNYIQAATSHGEVDIRLKFYTDETVYERLAHNGHTWQIYHDGVPQTWAYPKLWFLKNGGFRHFDHFADDVKKDRLSNYCFIEPKHFSLGGHTNNMHPGNNSTDKDTDFKAAENLVAYIYNLLNTNKKVFNKTLFIITFDEHGGFYDHVEPPACVPPDGLINNASQFKFDKLGIRIPTILISNKFKTSHVDSTLYDHSSVIKSVLENFGISTSLTARDKNANNLIEPNILQRKKNNLKEVDPHILATTTQVRGATQQTELNEFQKDLMELAANVDQVMDPNYNQVMANIKVLNQGPVRGSTTKVASPVDIKAVEQKFAAMYGG